MTVTAYSTTGCPAASLLATASATVTVTPPSNGTLDAFIGVWQCQVEYVIPPGPSTYTFYPQPFPTGTNYDAPPEGAQLMLIETPSLGTPSGAYSYLTVSGSTASDVRGAAYDIYAVLNGNLTDEFPPNVSYPFDNGSIYVESPSYLPGATCNSHKPLSAVRSAN